MRARRGEEETKRVYKKWEKKIQEHESDERSGG